MTWLPGLGTVRSRVIFAVIALTALALTIAGLTAYSLERALAEQRVQGYLDRSAEEFRVLANQGLDSTGRPFLESTVDELLRTAMQRQVLAANESELGILSGRVAWTAPEGVPLRPEQDAEFVAAILPLSNLDYISRTRLSTAQQTTSSPSSRCTSRPSPEPWCTCSTCAPRIARCRAPTARTLWSRSGRCWWSDF